MIGDTFEGESSRTLADWSGGELAWQGDGLAVVRAVY